MQVRPTPRSKRRRRKARTAAPKPEARSDQRPQSDAPDEDKPFNEPVIPPVPSVVPVEEIAPSKKPDETETCEPPDEATTISSDLN